MVGLVIVTHSAQLAQGVRELIQQMVQGPVPIAVAGGIDDSEHPFGTDVMRVCQAIESVYSPDGVVVLMDLGSALLSAETALEFLTPAQRSRVCLCAAPLIEGALAAAVQSAMGGTLEQAIAEAQGALEAKRAHLQGPASELSFPPAKTSLATTREERLIIRNRFGLHARPAAQLVATAAHYASAISIRDLSRHTEAVNAKSINQVITLGVRQGHEIAITATGPDADEALVALKALVERGFGTPEESPEPFADFQPSSIASLAAGELCGIPAAPGIAIGPAILYHAPTPAVSAYPVEDPQTEWQRLQQALHTAQEEIQTIRTQTAMHVSDYQAAIFDAHLLFLQDPTVLDAVHQRIWIHQLNAEAAWKAVVDEIIAKCHTLEDSYQRARAADVADIRDRVLHLLTGSALSSFILSTPSILVAPDLSPSDVMQLDPHQVVGICTARGGVTAHSAILARALGIPAVVGVGPALLRVAAGTLLALDGQSGKVWIKPDHVAVLQQQRAAWLISQQKTRANRQQPAITRDGHRIAVVANIRGIHDVPIAVECGAEGVGLLRTEFLYLHRVTAPAEEEQLAAYHSIATALGTRPLIIRTLDVGGDKRLSYLNLPVEANPFLGWRGIRLCLDYPALLKTQLRAILRASPTHQMKILFPMISSVAEVRRAKEILHAVQIELRHAEIPFDESMEVGIMVEVPSAVMVADQLAAEVDFFSIGTNDLSQYAMAADRTNTQVASLADALHPAVLRLIHHTVQAAHAAGIWVGVCGELTGDPLATPILLGMGVDELSINPSAIPSIKQQVRQLTMTEATALAQTVVNLHAAEAVRQYVTNWLSRHNQERIDPS